MIRYNGLRDAADLTDQVSPPGFGQLHQVVSFPLVTVLHTTEEVTAVGASMLSNGIERGRTRLG